jgi:glutathione S-transferase
MDQLMNVNDWYLFHGVGSVIAFQRIVGPRLMGLQPDEAAIDAALPKARIVIDVLSRELAARPFFVGDAPSLADVLLAPQLDLMSGTPEWRTLAAHPNLDAWLARMRARPSMAATTWERVAEMARAA